MTDSLIFIAQGKSRDIIQTRKYSAHCNRSIKDGRQNATIVLSLEKFDMILLFLRYFRVPVDWNNMSICVVKYFLCRHRHDFLMPMTCQHNCMSTTALVPACSKHTLNWNYSRTGKHACACTCDFLHMKLLFILWGTHIISSLKVYLVSYLLSRMDLICTEVVFSLGSE